MEAHIHSLNSLFDQLGLKSSDEAIADFIKLNGNLSAGTPIYQAKCWNEAQSDCLKEMIEHDADWSEIVDQLDNMLR
ncbi:DUF2789 domain-containing protein [Parashewanella spongiae]|uniref:DUF2789 domain-containing protein n=1 Tax=Parashewanella spongiae TaxID=342950 RepID=A0A3A6UCP3_9GAMM|nr:DUF2789 family protein [Parashewanella spongiae]MCL1078398.1 DUF2789 domain-containing protein [Parashewanella spongiae]RJY19429.1 DUF2789 domain-containing protein [Parashewanella spongiae]